MKKYQHSVSLDTEKCKGCTHCLKRCPTEAIRIRNGHAVINSERCIDCGECIRVCPYKAKRAICDKLDALKAEGRFLVALPAPSLYGQFSGLDDIDRVLEGLLEIGFDDVYEVATAAELVSAYTRRYLKRSDISKPIISSACPVVVRLISQRYPFLCDHVMPIVPPVEMAAMFARRRVLERHPELKAEDVCICFISPCPAKVSYVKNRLAGDKSNVDAVVSVNDIYFALRGVIKNITTPQPLARTGMVGIGWASTGGEATAVFNDKYLAADGIENVIRVLEEIDNENFADLDFIELNACDGGCVGGVMTVENPYIAQARLQMLKRYLPVSQNWVRSGDGPDDGYIPDEYFLKSEIGYEPLTELGDRNTAVEKLKDIEKLYQTLPALDCGSCGSPTCMAFAEDVIKGYSTPEECIVCMREKIKEFLGEKDGKDE